MSLYLLINIGIILFPLFLSFESKLKFYKKFPRVLISSTIVGIPFIVWDSIFSLNNVWSFNSKYVYDIRFLHLPLEELLFFITVPYSILFLYETFLFYTTNSTKEIKLYPVLILAIVTFSAALFFPDREYTICIFLIVSAIFIAIYFHKPKFIFREKIFYFLLFTFAPFGVVNYILTSIPIVSYNNAEIIGIRLLSIPIEDFFYSFSLIFSYIYFYEMK